MKVRDLIAGMIVCLIPTSSFADMWTDYSPSKGIWDVTEIKVQSYHLDDYLKGLSKTWVPSREVDKKNGVVIDYRILVNKTPDAAGATVLLMAEYPDWSALSPDKARDQKLMIERNTVAPKSMVGSLVGEYDKYRTIIGEGYYWSVEYPK